MRGTHLSIGHRSRDNISEKSRDEVDIFIVLFLRAWQRCAAPRRAGNNYAQVLRESRRSALMIFLSGEGQTGLVETGALRARLSRQTADRQLISASPLPACASLFLPRSLSRSLALLSRSARQRGKRSCKTDRKVSRAYRRADDDTPSNLRAIS